MNDKKLGQEPAFPEQTWEYDGQGNVLSSQNPGMSKRFYAVCAAMQGILASPNAAVQNLNDIQKAEYSFIMADKLLKQEDL